MAIGPGPGHGTADPHPHRHPRFAGGRGWRSHPRFAGDRGSIPTAIPNLPESGIQLSIIATDPSKHDPSVLLALNPIKVYESIISSGIAGTEHGRFKLPWLALSVMSGHTSNASSEGCHSIAQLIMSDLQTSMGDDILQPEMIVCLRAVTARRLLSTSS
jgi:hypothetical protein